MAQYRNFVEKAECQTAFAEMLRLATDPENAPLVQHCRGGKDRTGFGAMLLLGILGVSKADIIADYMLTHYNRLARNEEKMAIYRTFTQDQDVLDYLLSLIDTQPEFIEQSLNTIETQYGTIEQYAQRVLGITAKEIEALRANYLA
ncbi:Protein tyrosine/serine phosphatase [Mannheimia haemolytica]|nr:Protein tyrosine/serine phosphatase [Mannheimia haemolytica]